jgi:nitroreductase
MDALTALHTRNSVSTLGEPGPTAEQLDNILKAGLRANDRKKLRPWQFLLIEGEARTKLGEMMLETCQQDDPFMSDEAREKERKKPLRAPLIIVVVARIRPDDKVPDEEQLLSAGGAAQMMSLAAHAQGIGCIWRTGAAAYDKRIHDGLDLEYLAGDRIVGFLYLGTPKATKALTDFNMDEIVKKWP